MGTLSFVSGENKGKVQKYIPTYTSSFKSDTSKNEYTATAGDSQKIQARKNSLEKITRWQKVLKEKRSEYVRERNLKIIRAVILITAIVIVLLLLLNQWSYKFDDHKKPPKKLAQK